MIELLLLYLLEVLSKLIKIWFSFTIIWSINLVCNNWLPYWIRELVYDPWSAFHRRLLVDVNNFFLSLLTCLLLFDNAVIHADQIRHVRDGRFMVPLNMAFIRNFEGGRWDALAGIVNNELWSIVWARIPWADKDHWLRGEAAETEPPRVLMVC